MPFVKLKESAANFLTNRAFDPASKIPEFKVCAVRVEPKSSPEEGEEGASAHDRRHAALGDLTRSVPGPLRALWGPLCGMFNLPMSKAGRPIDVEKEPPSLRFKQPPGTRRPDTARIGLPA